MRLNRNNDHDAHHLPYDCRPLELVWALQRPRDGRERIFHDELLDNLVGDWKVTRKFQDPDG
jgi:hypothetical protein